MIGKELRRLEVEEIVQAALVSYALMTGRSVHPPAILVMNPDAAAILLDKEPKIWALHYGYWNDYRVDTAANMKFLDVMILWRGYHYEESPHSL